MQIWWLQNRGEWERMSRPKTKLGKNTTTDANLVAPKQRRMRERQDSKHSWENTITDLVVRHKLCPRSVLHKSQSKNAHNQCGFVLYFNAQLSSLNHP